MPFLAAELGGMEMRALSRLCCVFLSFHPLAYGQDAVLSAQQDAWLNGNNPSRNLGDQPVIVTSNVGPKIGLLQFNVSTLSGNEVASATLNLFVDSVESGGTIRLHRVQDSWSEGSVSLSTAPPFDTTPLQTFPIATAQVGGVIGVDLTATVQGWLSDPSTNFGIALASTDAFSRFGSKEGGMPATVDVVFGESGRPNVAHVAKEGGDYSDPLAAMTDLDSWCDRDCVLTIGPGRFELTSTLVVPPGRGISIQGAGRDATTLFSEGLTTTIQGEASFSSFSVEADGDNGATATAMIAHGGSLLDLSITARRATTATGIRTLSDEVTLKDVMIVVTETVSGTGVERIEGEGLGGEGIRIIVVSTGDAFGVVGDTDEGIVLRDFQITVNGQGSVHGLVTSCDCLVLATNGFVLARGGADTAAIHITETDWTFVGMGLRAQAVSSDGQAVGINASNIDSGVSLRIKNSEVTGTDTGILLTAPGGPVSVVEIDQSTISGSSNSIVGQPGWQIRVGATKLGGPTLPQGSTMTCAFVYDQNYSSYADTCP